MYIIYIYIYIYVKFSVCERGWGGGGPRMAGDYMMRDILRCLGELLQIRTWLHMGRLPDTNKNKPAWALPLRKEAQCEASLSVSIGFGVE